MNYYGFPPGYHPTAPSAEVPANVTARARMAGATHISGNGKTAYVKRFQHWYRAEWQGVHPERSRRVEFGSWWPCEGLPEGAVRVE